MYKNNKIDVQPKSNALSFPEWVRQNTHSIESYLINDAIDFINEQGEDLKVPVTHIFLDNAWHYIDKPKKKQSYKGCFNYDSDGTPWLNLVFYTFRHGGLSIKFDSKSALKNLWKQYKGETFTPIKPSVQKPSIKPEPKDNVDYISKDLDLFESLDTAGHSKYLNNKGIGDKSISGIRYADNYIAIKIIDADGAGQGLQKIYDNGNKVFSKGLTKKGNFALIGQNSLPEKVDTIHIAEGVATAATISLCLNEPAFCVLDAGNILPASRNLKKHYPKAKIIIWADNDWQKQDKIMPNGKLLGNTGLIQANHAAFKLRGAKVCAPDFSSFKKDEISNATDFNDLFVLIGEKAILDATTCEPDISLALFHDLRKYKKLHHGQLSTSNFKEAEKIIYNERYLHKNILSGDGVHLVRSAIGTGKTEVIANLLKDEPDTSILFTTHLISLVESAASRLGLISYHQCDNYDLQMERQVAICLNSLGKLTAEGPARAYDVVVIDEIEQVLARLTTKIKQKPLILSVLEHLMKHAKKVVCLDADLSARSTHIIKSFCPDKKVFIHFNEFEMGKDKEIVLHETKEDLQMNAISAIELNQKAYLAFNSKKEASRVFKTFKLMLPNKKGLYISGDNAGDEDVKAFFEDVNTACTQYDYIICTPSVSTGVSIDNNYFSFVGGVFNAQINTANDCMQALGRVRNTNKIHVFCEKKRGANSLEADVIASRWSRTHAFDLSLMSLNDVGEKILLNPVYETLNVLVTQAKNRSFNDFFESFCLIGLNDGATFSYSNICLEDGVLKHFKDFKKESASKECDAPDDDMMICASEIKALANKSRKTMEETLRFKRQHIIDFYKLSPSDKESIEVLSELDNDGRFRKNVLNLELGLGTSDLAKNRFEQQLEDGPVLAADLKHYATLQTLLKKLLNVLQISFDGGSLTNLDCCYDNQQILDSDFIDWVEERRDVLQGIVTIPSLSFMKSNPLSFVSTILQKMGLKQKRVGRSSKGIYTLDKERLDLMSAILAKRAGKIGEPISIRPKVHKKKEMVSDLFSKTLGKIKALIKKPALSH